MTIFLIIVCCAVAALSQFGDKPAPVSSLYFSQPPTKEQLTQLTSQLEALESAGDVDSLGYQEALTQYENVVSSTLNPLAQIKSGQLWRLVTPMFLHFGPLHLIFNMMWLWQLGRVLETLLRSSRFTLLVIVIAVISNLAQALGKGPNFGGMSGVVYGLFGYVVVHGKLNPMSGLQLDSRTTRYMLIWLALCFTPVFGPIANWAHCFGLFTGGLIGACSALRNGGWKALRRKHEFRRAIINNTSSIHHCEVCGKTEQHDPDLEFRVGTDGKEYCEHHLQDVSR